MDTAPRRPVSTHSRPKAAGKSHCLLICRTSVSTHSRPKAAGTHYDKNIFYVVVSTHSRPKAAGNVPIVTNLNPSVSTHSRPKAAGSYAHDFARYMEFQHTAARRRLVVISHTITPVVSFQHTAARRRLGALPAWQRLKFDVVSTHSRPKAAGTNANFLFQIFHSFNTQPPEGGWEINPDSAWVAYQFQHTAARRRLDADLFGNVLNKTFQHTAARRRLA